MKVKECKDLNCQLFPVSNQCRAGSSLSVKPGLLLDWTLPGVKQLRAFMGLWWLPPNFQLFLELERRWGIGKL